MRPKFTFQTDRARGLVRITMHGLYSQADIDAFLAARTKAHAELGCGPNQHLTLNDLRGVAIQPQEIVAAFKAMLAAPQYRSRRLAFVAKPTLARSQLMRALASREARCFEDPAEAEAWLLAEERMLRRA